MKLPRSFWKQKSLVVSKKLLGKYLCTKTGGRTRCGMVVETEGYPGPYDKASHAFNFKKTTRNEAEYREGGHVYIYMVYGMYWQLNISTGKAGYPECVLIRALEPIIANSREYKLANNRKSSLANISEPKLASISDLTNGPGKLCRWLKLNKSFYGEDVTRSRKIWFTEGAKIKKAQIAEGPRVGIDYAGPKWAKKPWRFYIKNNHCVSHR